MLNVILFFSLGGGEIFMILLITLLLFGSKRIPEIARGLGKGIRQIKDATDEIQKDITSNVQKTGSDVENPINEITNTFKRGGENLKNKK